MRVLYGFTGSVGVEGLGLGRGGVQGLVRGLRALAFGAWFWAWGGLRFRASTAMRTS